MLCESAPPCGNIHHGKSSCFCAPSDPVQGKFYEFSCPFLCLITMYSNEYKYQIMFWVSSAPNGVTLNLAPNNALSGMGWFYWPSFFCLLNWIRKLNVRKTVAILLEEMALMFVGFYCVSAFDNTLDLIWLLIHLFCRTQRFEITISMSLSRTIKL